MMGSFRVHGPVAVWIILSLAGLAFAGSEAEAPKGTGVEVDGSSCWVGLAIVKLDVDRLVLVGDKLVGEYSIRVPLKSSKDENGRLELCAVDPVGDFAASGAKLVGFAYPLDKEGEAPRNVTAVAKPSPDGSSGRGVLLLEIDTGTRVLGFETEYRIIQEEGSLASSQAAGAEDTPL